MHSRRSRVDVALVVHYTKCMQISQACYFIKQKKSTFFSAVVRWHYSVVFGARTFPTATQSLEEGSAKRGKRNEKAQNVTIRRTVNYTKIYEMGKISAAISMEKCSWFVVGWNVVVATMVMGPSGTQCTRVERFLTPSVFLDDFSEMVVSILNRSQTNWFDGVVTIDLGIHPWQPFWQKKKKWLPTNGLRYSFRASVRCPFVSWDVIR